MLRTPQSEYKLALQAPKLDTSDFILLAVGYMEQAGKPSENPQLASQLNEIRRLYTTMNFEEAKKKIFEVCQQHSTIMSPEIVGLMRERVATLKDNPVENESRRFYETRLASGLSQNIDKSGDYKGVDKLLSVMRDFHIDMMLHLRGDKRRLPNKVSNLDDANNVLMMMLALNDNIEQRLKEGSDKYQRKDRENRPLQYVPTKGYVMPESRNTGIMRGLSPNFYDLLAEKTAQKRIPDMYLMDMKKQGGYSQESKNVPFTGSVSGTSFTMMALLDAYAQKYGKPGAPNPELQAEVNGILRTFVTLYVNQGFHSLGEMLDVINEPHIQALFQKYNIKPEFTFPEDAMTAAFKDAQQYAKRQGQRGAMHEELKQKVQQKEETKFKAAIQSANATKLSDIIRNYDGNIISMSGKEVLDKELMAHSIDDILKDPQKVKMVFEGKFTDANWRNLGITQNYGIREKCIELANVVHKENLFKAAIQSANATNIADTIRNYKGDIIASTGKALDKELIAESIDNILHDPHTVKMISEGKFTDANWRNLGITQNYGIREKCIELATAIHQENLKAQQKQTNSPDTKEQPKSEQSQQQQANKNVDKLLGMIATALNEFAQAQYQYELRKDKPQFQKIMAEHMNRFAEQIMRYATEGSEKDYLGPYPQWIKDNQEKIKEWLNNPLITPEVKKMLREANAKVMGGPTEGEKTQVLDNMEKLLKQYGIQTGPLQASPNITISFDATTDAADLFKTLKKYNIQVDEVNYTITINQDQFKELGPQLSSELAKRQETQTQLQKDMASAGNLGDLIGVLQNLKNNGGHILSKAGTVIPIDNQLQGIEQLRNGQTQTFKITSNYDLDAKVRKYVEEEKRAKLQEQAPKSEQASPPPTPQAQEPQSEQKGVNIDKVMVVINMRYMLRNIRQQQVDKPLIESLASQLTTIKNSSLSNDVKDVAAYKLLISLEQSNHYAWNILNDMKNGANYESDKTQKSKSAPEQPSTPPPKPQAQTPPPQPQAQTPPPQPQTPLPSKPQAQTPPPQPQTPPPQPQTPPQAQTPPPQPQAQTPPPQPQAQTPPRQPLPQTPPPKVHTPPRQPLPQTPPSKPLTKAQQSEFSAFTREQSKVSTIPAALRNVIQQNHEQLIDLYNKTRAGHGAMGWARLHAKNVGQVFSHSARDRQNQIAEMAKVFQKLRENPDSDNSFRAWCYLDKLSNQINKESNMKSALSKMCNDMMIQIDQGNQYGKRSEEDKTRAYQVCMKLITPKTQDKPFEPENVNKSKMGK